MKIYVKASKYSDIDITEEAIKNNGGHMHIGDYLIEIGRLYDRKTDSYSGGFGKRTIVHNSAKGIDREFNSCERAIEFLKKQLSKEK